jgi:hypothetical protein
VRDASHKAPIYWHFLSIGAIFIRFSPGSSLSVSVAMDLNCSHGAKGASSGEHGTCDQIALSRRKQGFESPRERHQQILTLISLDLFL